jgi:hypothetical protein
MTSRKLKNIIINYTNDNAIVELFTKGHQYGENLPNC